MRYVLEYSPVLLAAFGVSFIAAFYFVPASLHKDFDELLKISVESIDFGNISGYEPASSEFQISNISGSPLWIRLGVDCSCTTTNPSSLELQPNESCTVETTYTPRGSNDSTSISTESASVIVQAGSQHFQNSQALPLNARVFKPVIFDPAKLKPRLYAFEKEDLTLDLSLQNDVESIELVAIPDFLAEASISKVDPTFHVTSLRATFRGFPSVGLFKGDLRLRVNGEFEPLEIQLPVEATVVDPFIADQAFLELTPASTRVVNFKPAFPMDDWRLVHSESEISSLNVKCISDTAVELSVNSDSPSNADTSGYVVVEFEVSQEGGHARFTKYLPVKRVVP